MDEEGTDLPNISAARKEALHVAEGLFESAERRADLGEEWHIEVMNDAGTLMFRMEFLAPEIENIDSTVNLTQSYRSGGGRYEP